MSRGLCIAFGALLLMVAEPASAQQSGVAATLESGGQTSGCVEWSHQTIAKPGHKSPDQKLVYFRFVNKCGREVSVVLVSQTDGYAGRVSDHGSITLAPGQPYGEQRRSVTICFSIRRAIISSTSGCSSRTAGTTPLSCRT